MSDIVERLTAETVLETYKDGSQLTYLAHPLGKEAAYEINRLRAENEGLKRVIEENAKLVLHIRMEGEKLRAALKPFAKCMKVYPRANDDYEIGFGGVHDPECKLFIRDFRAAAAALKETESDEIKQQ